VEFEAVQIGGNCCPMAPMPDGTVIIATETGSSSPAEVLRVAFGEAPVSLGFLRDGFRVFATAGGEDDAFFVTSGYSTSVGDPLEGGGFFDRPLFIGHLPVDRFSLQDGYIPVLSGSCHEVGVAAPPGGGAVLASTCGDALALELTYLCVPG